MSSQLRKRKRKWEEEKKTHKKNKGYTNTHDFDDFSYEGGLKDDKPHGYGKQKYPDGSSYEGDFKDGTRDGEGIYFRKGGGFSLLPIKYEGMWKNDKRNGQGKGTNIRGEVYIGMWKDDKKNGQGKMTYSDRRIYEGTWKNGYLVGQVRIIYPNENVYVGEFKVIIGLGNTTYREPDGLGKMTYRDGSVDEGFWIRGKYKRDPKRDVDKRLKKLIYDHYQHNPTKTICGFCHDDIDDVTFEVRKCRHIYHHDCWVEYKISKGIHGVATCPLCRD